MRNLTHLGRRMTTLVTVGAIALILGAVTSQSAQASPSLGTLSITPTTGTESSGLSATLSAACPASATGIVGYMAGPGITEQIGGVSQSIIQGNRSVQLSFPISSIFRDVFQANAIATPSGTYTVRMACIGADSFSEVGEFAQSVNFTPRGGTNNATFAVVSNAPSTTTTLAVGSPDPIKQGTAISLTATVIPSNAVGTVTFKRGSVAISASPIAVSGGIAQLSNAVLPAGTQSLTAVFTPTDSTAFGSSASEALPYVVAGPASISGVKRVGSKVTCVSAPTVGATKAYAWFRAGIESSITTSALTIPVSWLGVTATCAVKTTKSGVTVTQTSPVGAKVAAGAASVAKTKPSVLGTPRVGRILTCSKGTWSPAPSRYAYKWLRSGKVITGKTASTYKVVSSDKYRTIACRVFAIRAGYITGVATSPARTVR